MHFFVVCCSMLSYIFIIIRCHPASSSCDVIVYSLCASLSCVASSLCRMLLRIVVGLCRHCVLSSSSDKEESADHCFLSSLLTASSWISALNVRRPNGGGKFSQVPKWPDNQMSCFDSENTAVLLCIHIIHCIQLRPAHSQSNFSNISYLAVHFSSAASTVN